MRYRITASYQGGNVHIEVIDAPTREIAAYIAGTRFAKLTGQPLLSVKVEKWTQ